MAPETMVLIVVAALLIEAVVETVKQLVDWKNIAPAFIGALVVAVAVAVNFDIDLFAVAGLEGQLPYIGSILTGFILARGSNVVSDLIGRLS